ncbi:MAG: hypothetical protein IKA05_09080 [Clostridia bacterium]|nr:hypothetical protein [Clostridia bacterium]
MKKTGMCMLLVVMLLATAVVPAYAALPEDNTVMPLWTNTNSISYAMLFEDGIGYAESNVVARYSPKTFNISTYVYVKSGSEWVYVTEKHESKTGMSIGTSCSFDAVYGADYKVDYVFTVSGNGVDEVIEMTDYDTYD